MKGEQLEYIRFRHPLFDRDSLGVLGAYVTLEAGTGVVHTAPGHGADDFNTGQKYGLEISRRSAPAAFSGHGRAVRRPARVRRQRERRRGTEEARAPVAQADFSHQYPHCWRCHNPVIFLATSQWFIRMDGEPAIAADGGRATLREAALHAIDNDVKWIPAWGHDRISNMVVKPSRLVHLAPARLGRADSGGGLHEVRRSAADAGPGREGGRRSSRRTARMRGTNGRSRSSSRQA